MINVLGVHWIFLVVPSLKYLAPILGKVYKKSNHQIKNPWIIERKKDLENPRSKFLKILL